MQKENVKPLGEYILVTLLNGNEDNVLDTVEEKQFKVLGIIESIGSEVVGDIKEGDKVLFEDYGRVMIPDSKNLAVIKSAAVIAKFI